MTDLYLILHKVRGQPAFDIARLCEDMGTDTDPGPWWIIPTSGHRAHPSDYFAIGDLRSVLGEVVINHMDATLDDLPDHYQYDLDRTPPSPILNGDVASALSNLIPKKEPIRRRI